MNQGPLGYSRVALESYASRSRRDRVSPSGLLIPRCASSSDSPASRRFLYRPQEVLVARRAIPS